MITARLMTFSSSRTLPGHGVRLDRGERIGQQRHRAAPLLGGELAHEGVREQRGVALARRAAAESSTTISASR